MNVIATPIPVPDGEVGFPKVDLVCKQGKTLTWIWQLFTDNPPTTPMNLTGYLARGQVRKKFADPTAAAAWACTIPNPTDGKVQVTMDASISATIPAGVSSTDPKSQYVYDVELYTVTTPEVVAASIGGKFSNDPEATK